MATLQQFIMFLRISPWVNAGIAIIMGAIYGLLMRLAMEKELMTICFIFLVPIAIGFLTVWFSPEKWRMKWWYAVVMPWLSSVLFLIGAMLTNLEGLICIAFIFPVVTIFGSVGGLCARILAGFRTTTSARQQSLVLVSLVIIPLVSVPLENSISGDDRSIKTVKSEIRIHAPKNVVWHNIIRVPTIQPQEQTISFFQHIGFPKPLEATLSYEGVGGVRQASFERGVVFTETITDWCDQELISFSIKANTEAIPPTTFDEHVTIGGQYFDILQGTYRLEQQGDDVILHLWSEQRLSTNFNLYAGLWTGAIMQDIQSNILMVIKRRCEAGFGK